MSITLFISTQLLIIAGLISMAGFIERKMRKVRYQGDFYFKVIAIFLAVFTYFLFRNYLYAWAPFIINRMDHPLGMERVFLGITLPLMLALLSAVLFVLPNGDKPRNNRLILFSLSLVLLFFIDIYIWSFFADSLYALLPNASFALSLLLFLVFFVRGKKVKAKKKTSQKALETKI